MGREVSRRGVSLNGVRRNGGGEVSICDFPQMLHHVTVLMRHMSVHIARRDMAQVRVTAEDHLVAQTV